MDDRQIENMLRDSWDPQPPDGMRERVLRRAQEQSARSRSGRPILGTARWKLALAGLGIAVVLLGNISDYARQSRIAQMMDGVSSTGVAVGERSLLEQRREIEKLLAQALVDDRFGNGSRGDNSL